MITIKSNFKAEYVYKDFNKLLEDIKAGLKIENEKVIFSENYPFEYTELVNLLYNYLYERTNFKGELNSLKISYKSINLLNIFRNMINDRINFNIEEFLKYLSRELEDSRENPIKRFKFLFVTNLERNRFLGIPQTIDNSSELSREEFLKDIINSFDIKKFDVSNYSDESDTRIKELKELLEPIGVEVFEREVSARDEYYAFKEANYYFESFLGLISFIFNRFKIGTRWSSIGEEDARFFKVSAEIIFVLINSTIEDSYWSNITQNKKQIKKILQDMNIEKLNLLEELDFVNQLLDMIQNIENKGLIEKLYTIFTNYYHATSEKTISYSFLKYWMVSEFLIQSTGGTDSDEVLKIMKNILDFTIKDKPFLAKRIRYLNKKRNRFVHLGEKNDINHDDKNLSKLISDSLIMFFIHSISYLRLKNMNEFKFTLKNVKLEIKDIKRTQNILNLFKEWKDV